jgi:hypothetical protein
LKNKLSYFQIFDASFSRKRTNTTHMTQHTFAGAKTPVLPAAFFSAPHVDNPLPANGETPLIFKKFVRNTNP